MIFPDLIYTGEMPAVTLDPIVFEDMKLNSMIREDITEVMGRLCGGEDIAARQAVFAALDEGDVTDYFEGLARIAAKMADLDEAYREARCDEERQYIFLHLIRSVCDFVHAAAGGKDESDSLFVRRFIGAFREYAADKLFCELDRRSASVLEDMTDVTKNSFIIEGEHLKVVRTCEDTLSERIRRCAADLGIAQLPEKKPVERILTVDTVKAIAGLYPAQAGALSELYESYHKVYNADICKYRVQLDFYLQIKALMKKIASYGIPVRYPRLTEEKKIEIRSAYDVTLLTKQNGGIIPNDISFSKEEPFFYLTGANGGGKTTYLRTVGNAVLLALCGCPVPCEDAELYPMKRLYTHFPRDERFDNTGRFVDEEMRITKFTEKPKHPDSTLASMGIYIFNWSVLKSALIADHADEKSQKDFGKNIIPRLLGENKRLYAYRFAGYWKDVGTIDSYYEAQMDLLEDEPEFGIFDPNVRTYSNANSSAPHYIGKDGSATRSLVSNGCVILGKVNHSILSSDVTVEEGAVVEDAILLPGAKIGAGAKVIHAIVGEDAIIGPGAVLQGTDDIPVVGDRVRYNEGGEK